MSRKMSRKSVLIAQLAEDEKVKDALKLFAARIVNNSKLSSIYDIESDTDDEELTDGEVEEIIGQLADDDADDEEDVPDLCSDCQCAKAKPKAIEDKKQTAIAKSNPKTNLKIKKTEEVSIGLDDGSDDQSCDCNDCQQFDIQCMKSDENAIKLVAEEEKKKRKSEKKKLQKKKKRDKRKAEKQTNSSNDTEYNGQNQTESNESNTNNKKIEKDMKSNSISNKSKTETKMTAKSKNINNLEKNNPKRDSKQKDIENKSNSLSTNSKDMERHSSNKSSPKSDRENDVLESDLEEEELSFSSAYVSQIAQRKSKPSYIQKTAQLIPNEAQDFAHLAEDSSLKNVDNLSDNTNNSNNNPFNGFNGFDDSFQNNKNYNNSNSSNDSKEMNEELPKYKQYFYEQKPKPSKSASVQMNQEMKNQNIKKSIEFAIIANERAENNKFCEAIDLFSQALALNPKDYRFYVNRSYCYDSIQDFRSALRDADTAIQLKSDWPKCHYRRGKALAGLKNYQESEISLKKVLTLEKDCDEALTELWHVRYGAIVDMGYDTTTATLYSSQYQSIKEALDALSIKGDIHKSSNNYNNYKKAINSSMNGNQMKNSFTSNNPKEGEIWGDDDIYISDDEYNGVREPTFEETSPTNPFGWKALWVGNVSLNAKLDSVTAMFRKFGNLNYCNIFKGNNGGNFILVHYDNPESPRLAMTKYQGKAIPGISINGTPLTIRFRPNKDQKKPNYDQRLESDECYYWRTTGCARGDKCLYKHIQSNKGVDKQAWMCNPLRKGLQPFNNKSQK